MSEKKTLLVVEDGDKITKVITPEFVKRAYEVITYKDATGVLVMARQIAANVMVLDGTLRGSGSVSALKSFARNANTASIPVIAIEGRTGAKEADLLAAGARAVMKEPIDPEKLWRLAEEHQLEDLDFTKPAPAVVEAVSEPKRLESLVASKLLDSPPDGSFDRLTRLASRLMVVPVSLASFVAPDRQFFKSEVGLEGKWKERRGTPLSHSFCQWVVSSKEPLVVDDARRHKVLRSNAAVEDLGVVAYAGVPIVGQGGEALGSMCAIDTMARSWTPQDVETLQDLALVAQSYAVRTAAKAAEAIKAVTRMMRRFGPRLRDDERNLLIEIIEEQAGSLAKA